MQFQQQCAVHSDRRTQISSVKERKEMSMPLGMGYGGPWLD